MHKHNQYGFGTVGLSVIVLVLAVLGFMVYKVFTAQKADAPIQTQQ